MSKNLYLFAILITCFISPLSAMVYYVDSQNGSDQALGTSEGHAWRSLDKVNRTDFKSGDIVRFSRGGLWRGSLKPKSGAANAPVTYTCFGPDDLPKPRLYGSLLLNRPNDWEKIEPNLWRTIKPVTEPNHEAPYDVGNLIFNGNSAGVKCWSKEQLKTDDCFWFDPETRHVWLFCAINPAVIFSEIEAALVSDCVVDLTNVHYVVFSGFDVRYGASHGFGGSSSSHVTIRDCDISWMGGGLQFTRADGVPVRYGNGIEFWKDAHDHLVENCRLWEIYDAALTNQGDGKNEQRNITYHNNIIWNCEYSFEYWNGDERSVTDNITFMHNTCLNAGSGWGHAQRPDPNGRHVMFWQNPAKTTNIVVTHNVFAYASESIVRFEGPTWWRENLVMNNNIWLQRSGNGRSLVHWQTDIDSFRVYQEKSGLDQNSMFFENIDI